jgi:hypothetical protein
MADPLSARAAMTTIEIRMGNTPAVFRRAWGKVRGDRRWKTAVFLYLPQARPACANYLRDASR